MTRINFNTAPYFDDYDKSRNFHQILIKAGLPVQARELNQIQSYTRAQLEILANIILKNGSIVSNSRSSLVKTDYVTVNEDKDLESLKNVEVIGEFSGLKATLIKAENMIVGEPATMFVNYTNVGVDGITNKFVQGETLNIVDSNAIVIDTVTVRCPSCVGVDDPYTGLEPTGYGHIYYVADGVVYFDGMFIDVAAQSLVVSKYEAPKSLKIGFDFLQSIIDARMDRSLLDNALGYPNETSEGADRYKAELKLAKYSLDFEDDDNFILMMRINVRGEIDYQKVDTEYSAIMDEMARREYEINGDCAIMPYRISFLESFKKDEFDPHGYDLNGDPEKLIAIVTPSIAYVKGYRNETIANTYIEFGKARDTRVYEDFVNRFDERTHFILQVESPSAFPNGNTTSSIIDDSVVYFYDAPLVGGVASGNIIGSTKINDMELVSVISNKQIYKYYVYDVQINSGKTLNDVKAVANINNQFAASPVLDQTTNTFNFFNTNASALIFKLDREHIKTVRDANNNNNGSININLRKKFKSTLDASGSTTFTSLSNEFFDAIDNRSVCFVTVNGSRQTILLTPQNSNSATTTLTLNLGSGFGGATVTLIQSVTRTSQKENRKTLVTINVDYIPRGLNEVINLGKADVYDITRIKLLRKDPVTLIVTEIADVTDNYRFFNNISDNQYGESYIKLVNELPNYDVDNILNVEFNYFVHSGNTGYFTVDSYADVFSDPSNTITRETIKPYISAITKVEYPLTQSIDFRPIVMASETINSITPTTRESMIYDIEYFLPRTDLLSIDKQGSIYIKKGIPSESPRPPKVDDDAMSLYEIWLSPYTYSLKDIDIKFIENKNYTHRDIGKIERRLENVEYYVALNLLEKATADMDVKDENGLDRFKNGFIVDNFQKFQAADILNSEFKASLDRKIAELRPEFQARNRKLVLNKARSTGFVQRGNMAMLPYTQSVINEQNFATKSISINPYLVTQRKGNLALLPNNDLWSDDTRLPDMVHNIDTGTEALKQVANAAGVLNTQWGSWADQNSTVVGQSVNTTVANINQGLFTTSITNTATATTIATNQQREGAINSVGSRTDNYSLGDVVRNVQMKPFIRSRIVQFSVTGLSASTVYYPYFDNSPVSMYCRDIGHQITAANAAEAAERLRWGSRLVSDSKGQLLGEFKIPDGLFFTGQRSFIVTTNSKFNIEDDAELSWSIAEGEYYAGGLDVEKQNISLNVISPTFSTRQVTESRTVASTMTSTSTTVVNRPNPPILPVATFVGRKGDPVAQSFILPSDTFITALDVYFETVDTSKNEIFFELRTMTNGNPTEQVLASKTFYDLSSFTTSPNADVPFHVEFDTPTFIPAGVRHCFVVGGDNDTTRIFVAKLGQYDVKNPSKMIEQQPNAEPSFRSRNGSTWTAEQLETIKYRLYGATFDTTSPMQLEFNQVNESITLEDNPIETEVGSLKVRIHCEDHGFVENDRFNLSLLANEYMRVRINPQSGAYITPIVGQKIRTTKMTAIVQDCYAVDGTVDEFMLKMSNVTGTIVATDNFVCESFDRVNVDNFVMEGQGSTKPTKFNIPEITGQFLSDFQTIFPNGLVNGIPIAEFNREHYIKTIDTPNSFVIDVNVQANATGRVGYKGCQLSNFNHKYEVFNISGALLPYTSSQTWTMTGIGHGVQGSRLEQSDYQIQPELNFNIGDDTFLSNPFKIAGDSNELRVLGAGNHSVSIKGTFGSGSDRLSPVLNLDTFSMITVSNKVSYLSEEKMNVAPNADGRFVPETDMNAGSESFKYVTKLVTLANPADDVNIAFDVYKDIDADFDIYIKRLSMYSNETIDEVKWEKFEFDKSFNSFDLTNRIEYEINTRQHMPNWLNANGENEPVKSFKVKIVGRSQNTAKPPLFRSFRATALT